MKQEKDIQKFLHKFILNQCNEEEIEEVIAYCRKKKPSEEFPTVEEVIQLLEEIPEMDEAAAHRIYERIINTDKQQDKETSIQPAKKQFIWRYVAAALFTGLLAVGYFYQQGFFTNNTHNIIIPKEEAVTLQLDDGKIELLSENGTSKVTNTDGSIVGTQEGNQLIYTSESSSDPDSPDSYQDRDKQKKLAYNTLTVPYGKKFKLQLSDGTHVHLNSGTSLKYPVNFLKGENRQVFLSGEAYFDVATDNAHPFIVNADELNIRVLGTQFNVASYSEDAVTDVVLIEGSVSLYKKDETADPATNTLLEPGFKGSFDREKNTISSKKVITSIYTSWINGELIFRDMSFENILKKLERHYNVSILNRDKALAKEKFNASFVNEPIEKVLQNLKTTYGIDFRVNNNQIIIE